MTGDHEVLALVVEGTQAVGVQIGDDVRHGERRLAQLGKELAIGVGHPSIDVAHVGARVRNGKRGVPGTQLHAFAYEIPCKERGHGRAIQRLDSHHHPLQCSGGLPEEVARHCRPLRSSSGCATQNRLRPTGTRTMDSRPRLTRMPVLSQSDKPPARSRSTLVLERTHHAGSDSAVHVVHLDIDER